MPAASAMAASVFHGVVPWVVAQLALASPCASAWISNEQSEIELTSMNWPSQKRAPFGSEHLALQPPLSSAVQLPEQSTLHWRFASAVQLPSQEALHCASQLASGGVPSQLTLQLLPQLALQVPSHSALFASAAHDPEQSASHLASQLPSHEMPPLAMHSALQSALQLPLHSAVAEPVQPPSHFAWQLAVRLTGSHLASQPPDTMNSHEFVSRMTTSPSAV